MGRALPIEKQHLQFMEIRELNMFKKVLLQRMPYL